MNQTETVNLTRDTRLGRFEIGNQCWGKLKNLGVCQKSLKHQKRIKQKQNQTKPANLFSKVLLDAWFTQDGAKSRRIGSLTLFLPSNLPACEPSFPACSLPVEGTSAFNKSTPLLPFLHVPSHSLFRSPRAWNNPHTQGHTPGVGIYNC